MTRVAVRHPEAEVQPGFKSRFTEHCGLRPSRQGSYALIQPKFSVEDTPWRREKFQVRGTFSTKSAWSPPLCPSPSFLEIPVYVFLLKGLQFCLFVFFSPAEWLRLSKMNSFMQLILCIYVYKTFQFLIVCVFSPLSN